MTDEKPHQEPIPGSRFKGLEKQVKTNFTEPRTGRTNRIFLTGTTSLLRNQNPASDTGRIIREIAEPAMALENVYQSLIKKTPLEKAITDGIGKEKSIGTLSFDIFGGHVTVTDRSKDSQQMKSLELRKWRQREEELSKSVTEFLQTCVSDYLHSRKVDESRWKPLVNEGVFKDVTPANHDMPKIKQDFTSKLQELGIERHQAGVITDKLNVSVNKALAEMTGDSPGL